MKSFRRLMTYLKRYKAYLALSVLCNVLTAIFTVVSIPLIIPFFQILFDRVPTETVGVASWKDPIAYLQSIFIGWIENHGRESALVRVCLLIVLSFFFKNLFRYLALFFMAPVRNGIIRDIRARLFSKFLQLPLSYYAEVKKGDLLSRISSDVMEVEWSVLNVLEMLFKSPLIIIGSILIMIYIHPGLTIFVFVLLLVTAFIIGSVSRSLKRQSSAAQQQMGSLMAMVEEAISGLRIIKGFNASAFIRGHFEGVNDGLRRLTTRMLRRRDLSSPLSEFLGIVVVAILLWYGAHLVFNNTLLPETFFAFIFAFYQVIEPSKSFSSAYYNIQKGMAAAERVDAILLDDARIEQSAHASVVDEVSGDLVFKDVSFRYAGTTHDVLQDVSFTLPHGQTLAVVGESGAGKTTLTDLIPRFYDVTKGGIFLNGADIRSYDLASLRSLMAIVSQEAILFHDSIYNNIVFGLADADPKQVEQAARLANAHDFIMELPEGYQSVIGDRGQKLSGGQRQRITIARALLRNPSILILDEATSALDSESEKAVQEALSRVLKGRTSIVVAHRMSTIRNADVILVLRDGRVVEHGNHDMLMSSDGDYRKFVMMQGA